MHWAPPEASGLKTGFTLQTENLLDIDPRGMFNFVAFAPPKKTGEGSFYLGGIHDSKGEVLNSGHAYSLHVPPNVPAAQYWSVTVYDAVTSAFVHKVPVVSLDSYNRALQKNANGSLDIYFGPKAPAGKESNWLPTKEGRNWKAIFHLYGPEKPLLDKTWRLPDIERVSGQ